MLKFTRLFATVLLTFISLGLFGQAVTTSSMTGKITDDKGQPMAGATVVALHTPSGTQYGALTNADGFFKIQGMRPGGPYSVEISFVGYAKKTIPDVSLSLGEALVLNASIEQSSAQLNEVVVTATKAPTFNSEKNGTSINITNTQMVAIPSVSRSINDVTRLTPQSNGNQIGGGNYRQNFILVDGAQFNNAFGIGTNLPGNGIPISLDALDQISVNITPYDVRQSGFIGASVNAVTRSGTNEFSASVYGFYNDETYKGNRVGDLTFTKTPAKYKMEGFRIGGPIIKNKLFFFFNYEQESKQVPGPVRVASSPSNPPNYPNNVARPTVQMMDSISKYLSQTYGYETGPYQGYSNESPGHRLLARVDWNINNNHKFNLRYSNSFTKDPNYPSTSVSPFSGIYTNNRQAMDAMWYKNSGYYQEYHFTSIAGELNSTFGGGRFTNTLRGTYSYQNEPRSTDGKLFPFVDILQGGIPYVSFGTELFSYGNLRQVKTLMFTDDFTWSMGINNFTAGLSYEHDNTKNGFMRFGSSFYVFNSWNDFITGAKPADFGITFSNSPGYAQAFPSFRYGQSAAYIQDEIVLSSKLKITAGLRVDLPTYPEPLALHPIIDTLVFGGKSYHTNTLPKSRLMWSPRIGFNYSLNDEHTIILRGGTGIFTGRVPFVWIVGQAGDAGMLQTTQTFTGQANTPGPFDPSISKYYPATQPAAGTIVPSTFTMIDPNFKMPQTWKSSLAVDAKLPWGFKGTIEGIYNKDFNTAFFVNEGLRADSAQAMNIGTYPDHRLIYPLTTPNKSHIYYYLVSGAGVISPAGTNGVSPIVLENRKGGYYYSLTFKLEKSVWKGLSGMVAYTYSKAKNLVDGSGDQASSAWNGNANVSGANHPELSYASYVVPSRVIGALNYRIEEKRMGWQFSLFYEGASAGRFSYVYSSNILRDGAGSNNLIYIPKDPSEITFVNQTVNGVVWTAQQQSDAFFAYIEQDKYLRAHKGEYAERNGALYPWVNRFDLKLAQDFYINVAGKKNTLEFTLDILNFGNLLNKKWGNTWQYNQNNILVMTNNGSVTYNGTTVPTFRLNPYNNAMLSSSFSKALNYASTYSMQIGVRYIFN
ncbi:MAG TPA: TonB-dependent receptor [Bacteroidales bacterium]|nr:TonB-dependent receptor [Bacteroidales bacterium]